MMQIETLALPFNRTGKFTEGADGTRSIMALCDELWAIHPSLGQSFHDETGEPLFTLTHKATNCVTAKGTRPRVLETLRVIRERGMDFSFTDPRAAAALKEEYREVRAEVERRLKHKSAHGTREH